MTGTDGRRKDEKRPTLAVAAKRVMIERSAKYLWAGDPDLCLQAYELSGGNRVHPLNRIRSVIDAVRRSPDFVQVGYIKACDSTGRREIMHPAFSLRDA